MSLAAGERLGPYEIVGPLGSGGMGEVYRARDTRLGREVAIKILPAERLADEGRRRRFVQEARAASALNHPNIVTIYEIESADGIDFIVMELVPGKTLDDLIPRHGMRLGEVLRIAIPLADALAAAHGAGIVHRDLKPANVMVTPEGVVKVLDFGLAKLTQAEEAGGEDDTTLDARAKLSRPGTVAGTPAYMSPEQASGAKVDARSDIFSFGVVLYEMATGRRPFAGESNAERLAALLKGPPPPGELVADLPKELERIILRCLKKEPDRRFQSTLDVKVELQELKEESDSQASAPTVLGRRRSARRLAWTAAGLAILTLAALTALWRWRRSEVPPPIVVQLTSARRAHNGSFSPDGTQIVFASTGDKGDNWDIFLKIVGEPEARRLTTDPAVDDFPSWSPDGKLIAFLRHSGIRGARAVTFFDAGIIHTVSPLGGPERRLSDFPARGQLSWSPDGRWLAAARARVGADPPGGISLIPTGRGEPRAVTFPRALAFDVTPAFSPDGRALAFASCEGAEDSPACDVHVQDLDAALRPEGTARRLTRQRVWAQGLTWARHGRSIVYGVSEGSRLWRVGVDGAAPPERLELAGPGASWPSAAVGRNRLSFTRLLWDPHIYRLSLPAVAAPAPLIESTRDAAEFEAFYSPDGGRIAFQSNRGGAYDVWLADGDGANLVQLTRGPGRAQATPRWSPDGRTIAFASQAEDGHWDMWTIGVDGSGLRQLTRDPTDERTPSWSHDGRFLYFVSDRTGRQEVFRVDVLRGTEEQLTHEGGVDPHESRDGRTLYYMRADDDALLARPTAGGPERVILPCVHNWSYAVGPDGIFYVDCGAPGAPPTSRRTLRHWNAATSENRVIATLETSYVAGLSVSPDGRTILYAPTSWGTSDLMMLDNFR